MSTACFHEKHRHHQTHFSYFYGRFNCSIASDSFEQTIKVIPERISRRKVSRKFCYVVVSATCRRGEDRRTDLRLNRLAVRWISLDVVGSKGYRKEREMTTSGR